MKATRVNEMTDDVGARQVHIMNGPVVVAASHNPEGQRRFVVVTGTVVLDSAEVGAHAQRSFRFAPPVTCAAPPTRPLTGGAGLKISVN